MQDIETFVNGVSLTEKEVLMLVVKFQSKESLLFSLTPLQHKDKKKLRITHTKNDF